MQGAVGPRLGSRRLRLRAQYGAVEVYDCNIGADEANFPGRQCNRTSFESSAKNLVMPLIKLFSAYMKHAVHVREGGVVR